MRALLFDFFGTLVEYQPDRSRLGSPLTHELASSMGFTGNHDDFVHTWDSATLVLERTARQTLREFSMTDAAIAFGAATQLSLSHGEAETLGHSFVTEWAQHIRPINGVADLIEQLAEEFIVAVVSNTHDHSMVPNMLHEMGIDQHTSSVLLSVEHGWLKPHPSIYSAALDKIDCPASDATFVGDSFEADYAGPLRAGMSAFLIDPAAKHDIPTSHRLTSVLDIAESIRPGDHHG